jgi:RNA polymerase sigma-70 factor, ECF subfamily
MFVGDPDVQVISMRSSSLDTVRESASGERRPTPTSARSSGVHLPATHPVLYSWRLGSRESALQFQSFDATYVERLWAGDNGTQEHFVGYFTQLLRIKLRSRLQSLHAIEDVCQETFTRVLAVLRKDGGLRQPERLGAFVNTVCNNVLLEHYRSSKRSESLDEEGRQELPALGADSLDIVAARQIKDKVREILLELPLRDRSLLKAVFLDERDRDEVCREFGVDRDYLRVLLHRAKQQFKAEYVKRIGNQSPLSANG